MTNTFTWTGRCQEAVQIACRGLAYLQAYVSADRARLLAAFGHAHGATAGYEPAHEALQEALNMASQLSDPKLEARLLGTRSIVSFHFFRLREAAADDFLSEQLGGAVASPWQRGVQLLVLNQALFHLGRIEEAAKVAAVLDLRDGIKA